jgi:hypothetical protein
MLSCEACRNLLLDHLYDLLEADERAALMAHLETCGECRAALNEAKAQQNLLATAARLEFADVRFEAPPAPAPAPAEAPVLLPVAPRSHARKWLRYAVAASTLLGAGLLGWLILGGVSEHSSAQSIVDRGDAAIARAEGERAKISNDLNDIPRRRDKALEDFRSAQRDKQLRLVVTGPGTVQSGAPAEFQIQTSNLNGQPAEADVWVQVSTDGKTAAREIDVASKGNDALRLAAAPVVEGDKQRKGLYRVTLPPDLPLPPGSRPTLLVHARKKDSGTSTELRESLELAQAGYVTQLTTDKPMYQPGETVHFRSLTLDRITHKPPEEDLYLVFKLSGPTFKDRVILEGSTALRKETAAGGVGEAILGPDAKPVRGVGAGDLPLPDDLGGEYVLSVEDMNGRFARQERRFLVNRYQKHVLIKELDFNRTTFGPGDEVQALCKAKSASGPVKNARVDAVATVDGEPVGKPIALQTDDLGTVTIRFTLPKQIEKGQASLAVTFKDGALVETMNRAIPIVLKKLNVEFFPEGGDLVAGLPNRVYFQARTPAGKPADLTGRLFENGKPLDVVVETLNDPKEPGINQGQGRFHFTPKAKSRYELQIDSPLGITERIPLPTVKEDGVLLTAPEGVIAAGQPIRMAVLSTKPRDLLVGAYCRGRLLDSVQLKKGETELTLRPTTGIGGVVRVTVFEELPGEANRRNLRPVAERLIYRHPVERLRLDLHTDRASYIPGQKPTLSVSAYDEKDAPAPAIVMVAVVDRSVLAMADEKTARTMPTHFLLTTEVRRAEELEYADFLLGRHPRAAEALDLLLGTQGWRRFAEQNPAQFREELRKHGDADEAERLLVSIGQSAPQTRDFMREEEEKLLDTFDVEANKLAEKCVEAGKDVETARENPEYKTAAATLASYRQKWDDLRHTPLFPALAALFVMGALVLLFVALMREVRRAVPYYLGFALSTAAVVFIAVNFLDIDGQRTESKNDVLVAMDAHAGAEVKGKAAALPRDLLQDRDGAGAGAMAKVDRAPAPAMPMAPGAVKPGVDGAHAGDGKVNEGLGQGIPLAKADEKAKNAAELQQQNRGMDRDRFAGGIGGRGGEAKKQIPGAVLAAKGMAQRGDFAKRMEAEQFRRRVLADGKERRAIEEVPPLIVRVYAHEHKGTNPEERSDFAETLYWHPVLVLPDGKADVSFDLCDSVTRFQAIAFAHTLDGRLGAGTFEFESKLPFTLHPKTPIEVTANDTIVVPVGLSNNAGGTRPLDLMLKQHDGLKLIDGKQSEKIEVEKSTRRLYTFQPSLTEGQAIVALEGKTLGFTADAVKQPFRVVPDGFPRSGAFSDTLEGGGAVHTLKLNDWLPGTLQVKVDVYPSTMSDLQKGLEGLLREPGGCFEQTSTSSYPNTLILDYLQSTKSAKPEVEKRARELLGRGYQRLTAFECQNAQKKAREGYEWFGGAAPPHEALTAYGLLQFTDMARYQEVDPAMLKRTQEYLLSRRDRQGGFLRNDRALDTFGRASKEVTDAYIVWALTEAGCSEPLTAELDALSAKAKDAKDPYFLALVANSLINKGRTNDAVSLLETIVKLQKEDGRIEGADRSITSSRGRDLHIETTALTLLGWLKADPGKFHTPVKNAVKWIGQQRGGYGGFGSTQSTILALKALIEYTRRQPREVKPGELKLFVGTATEPSASLKFGATVPDTLTLPLPEAEKLLKAGDNKVRVEITGGNALPYTLSWSYRTRRPESAGDCPLTLTTTMPEKAKEGDVVHMTLKLTNTSPQGQGMAVAIIGLPGGMTLPEDMKQLTGYTRLPDDGSRPLIAAFELRGRELVLYWRDLQGKQTIEVPIDLICRVPGEYTGPASRAYLYYQADSKCWIDPLKVNITPAE